MLNSMGVLAFFKHNILATAGVSGVLAKAVKSCRCRKCTSATDKKLKNRILYGLAVLLCTIIQILSNPFSINMLKTIH